MVIAPSPAKGIHEKVVGHNVRFAYHGRNLSISTNSFLAQFLRAVSLVRFLKQQLRQRGGYVQFEGGSLGGIAGFLGFSGYVLDLPDLDFARQVFANPLLERIYRTITENLQKMGARKAGAVLSVSLSMKNYLIEMWNVNGNKIRVVPNGYSDEQVSRDGTCIRRGQVIYAGYIGEYIDAESLLRTAEAISPSGGTLVLAGDGPSLQYLKSEAQRRKLGNITFAGIVSLSEATRLVSESLIAVLPLRDTLHSRTCCPTKLSQYAILAKAIVTTRVSDDALMLEANSAAMVVGPNQASAFAEAVKELLMNPTLGKTLGERACRLFERRGWNGLAESVVTLYS